MNTQPSKTLLLKSLKAHRASILSATESEKDFWIAGYNNVAKQLGKPDWK